MIDCYLEGDERIYYRKNLFSNKPTLIFIHGLSGNSFAWKPYEKIFEKDYNILSLDLRGHGKSFRPDKLDDYSLDAFSRDLLKIIEKEKIKKSILISHSFGNLVALDFTKKYSEKIKSLILISANPAPAKRKFSKVIVPLIALSGIINNLPQIKKQGDHIDYSKYPNTRDWTINRVIADLNNTGIRTCIFTLNNFYKINFENFLSEIKVPVLIIHGNDDTIFPIESSREMSKLIKNSKFISFKNYDHVIVLNNYKELSGEINNFISHYN